MRKIIPTQHERAARTRRRQELREQRGALNAGDRLTLRECADHIAALPEAERETAISDVAAAFARTLAARTLVS